MTKRRYIRGTLSALLLFASVSAAASFDDPTSHTVGEFPAGVTIGDVNGDGLADVVVANSNSRDVSLLLNDGSGLGPEQRIGSGSGDARYVAIEDIDDDGDRDLVVLVRFGDSLIVVLRNQGDGTFATPEPHGVPNVAFALRFADIDRDGDPDALVLGGFDEATITPLRNDGNGSFEVGGSHVLATAFVIYVADFDVADFNGDGYPDVAGSVDNARAVAVLLNDGQGDFLPAASVDLGQQIPTAILARDVNGDGRPDLLVVDNCVDGDELRVALNDGAGGFVLSDVVPLTGACHSFTNPTGLASGQFDDDAMIDLVYASRSSDSVRVLRGLGDGTFEAAGVLPTGPDPFVVAAGDVNGDGRDDVISGNSVASAPDTITLTTQLAADTDEDGVDDDIDNCTNLPNPDQLDSDSDGIGNACDADLNGDCSVNFGDLAGLKAAFFPNPYNEDTDFDGDGFVNFRDLAFMKSTFFSGADPGPGPGTPGNACD